MRLRQQAVTSYSTLLLHSDAEGSTELSSSARRGATSIRRETVEHL